MFSVTGIFKTGVSYIPLKLSNMERTMVLHTANNQENPEKEIFATETLALMPVNDCPVCADGASAPFFIFGSADGDEDEDIDEDDNFDDMEDDFEDDDYEDEDDFDDDDDDDDDFDDDDDEDEDYDYEEDVDYDDFEE